MAVPDVIRECMMVTMLFLKQLESTTGHIEHKIHRGGHFSFAASRTNSLSRSVRASTRRRALLAQVHGGFSSTVRFLPVSAATIPGHSRNGRGRGFGFAFGSMKTGAGYFATAPSDCASAVFSGDSKANHAIAGDSGGRLDNAGRFASLEQEMARGRQTSNQVRLCGGLLLFFFGRVKRSPCAMRRALVDMWDRFGDRLLVRRRLPH